MQKPAAPRKTPRLSLECRARFDSFALDVSHSFDTDGITALYGPSGSGKTTVLRAIAGLEPRVLGDISFGDDIWQSSVHGINVAAHARGVGFVFQDARLFSHLDVAGNLDFAAKRAEATSTTLNRDDVVAALDLAPLLARRVDTLSGGERQRVAIARALLSRPNLLLMDEPLAALDVRRRHGILDYIEKLPSTFAVPIIYVTHALEEVTRIADRMAVMADGRIVASGPVADVLARLDLPIATDPGDAAAVVTATVASHDTAYALTRLELEGQSLVLPLLARPVGADVRVLVRARDVALSLTEPKGLSVRNCLSACIVEIVEHAPGADADVLLAVGRVKLRARITRLAVAELGLTAGQDVFALVKSVSFADAASLAPKAV